MPVTINQPNEDTIYVNGKRVLIDMDGQWICKEELTTSESLSLRKHLETKETG